MSAYITVEVTAADIKEGVPDTLVGCPIALALRRQTGEDWCVGWGYAWIGESAEDVRQCYALTKDEEAFIERFDHGEPVEPFSFLLPR